MDEQLSGSELDLFARHFSLPGFTHSTQGKLKRARVLVVGAGGLGCPALTYLAGAGVGHIGIVDGDTVSISNIHRQTLFFAEDIGESKVAVATERLKQRSPGTAVIAHGVFLSEANAVDICRHYDVILDGTDNFAAKYLLDRVCEQLRIPLVYASIFQFEGQLSVFHWQEDPAGPKSYRDLFPSPPPANVAGNCNDAGVLGVLPGILGVMQANEVIKLLTGIGVPLGSKLLTYDAMTCRSSVLQLKRRKAVPAVEAAVAGVCSSGAACWEISAGELATWLTERRPLRVIDVRGADEHIQQSIGGESIPLAQLPNAAADLPSDTALVFYCQSGFRSRKAVEFMRSIGRQDVFSLTRGMAGMTAQDIEAFRCQDAR